MQYSQHTTGSTYRHCVPEYTSLYWMCQTYLLYYNAYSKLNDQHKVMFYISVYLSGLHVVSTCSV